MASLFLSVYLAVLHLFNVFLIQIYTDPQMNRSATSNALRVHVDFDQKLKKYSDLSKITTLMNSTFSQVVLLMSISLIFEISFIFFILKMISMERNAVWIGVCLSIMIVPFLGCFENLLIFILALISTAKLAHAVSLHFL